MSVKRIRQSHLRLQNKNNQSLNVKLNYYQGIAQIYKEIYNIEKMNADIDAHRNEIQYFITKANYYQQINRTEQAFTVFDEYITLNPTSFDEKAKFMKYKCKPILIKQHWEKFLQSSDSSNLLKKAEIASIILKKHDQALSLIEKYIDMNPLEEQGHLAKIKHLQNIGKQKETLKAIDVYLDINPTNDTFAFQSLFKLSSPIIFDSVKECFKLLTLKSRLLGEDSKEKGLALIDQYLQKNPGDRKCKNSELYLQRIIWPKIFRSSKNISQIGSSQLEKYKVLLYLFFIMKDKQTFEDHNFFDEARDLIDQYIENHPSECENHKKLVNLLSK